MNDSTLKLAVEAAKKFIEMAKKAEPGCTSKENGAVKRASMDLSRALSEMRKPS